MSTPSTRPRWRRDVLLGVAWFVGLFLWDALDSIFNLRRAMGRIQTDTSTVEALRGAVIDFTLGAAGAYLTMGLMAGIMLTLLGRLWSRDAQSTGAWLKTAVAMLSISTVLGIARQLITFPTLYSWFPWRQHWAELAEPVWVDVTWVLAALGLIGLSWRRWGHTSARTFALRLGTALVYAAAIAALLQPLKADRAQDNDGLNLVLIGVDALRLDRLGHFGNARDTSPHIDKFLDESLVFTQAFTQLARTYPAWTTMLSGTWPTVHGIRDNLPVADKLVPEQALLPAVMRDAGFATGFATDDSRFSYMVPETGFEMIRQPVVGLQNFAISVNEPRFRAFHGLLHNRVGFSFLPVQAYNQSFGSSYRPDQFVEWAVDGLAELSRSDKFFYAMHSCVLHVPGDRVYPWYSMFGQDGYKGRNRFKYSASGSSLIVNEIEGARGKKAERIAEQDLRIYDSGIRMADDLVGAVLAELEASGLADNTVVVLFSDHGEEIWEPDLPYKWRGPNHGFHMYGEGHNNVVFAVRFPDGAHAGQVVSDPVRLIDLAPTVAEIFGLEWPGQVSGESVMPLVRGETEDAQRLVYMETGLSEPRYWVSGHKKYPFKRVSKRYKYDPETDQVHIRPKFLPHLIAGKDRAVQRGRWKLIWHALTRGIRVDLYDREADPTNRVDLAEDHPDVVEALGADLTPFLEGDGITPPPLVDWVRLSRPAKRRDKRYMKRMHRNKGTLPMTPTAAAKPTVPPE
jgi:arylsulfatase A-like enzyme